MNGAEHSEMSNRVREATYNIHKSRGLDWRVRPDRIVEVLREIDADIVALQEVVSASKVQGEDQARFIATELGYHSCFGENRRVDGAPYGNLLLSRFHMRASRNHDISTDDRERRGCLRADIAIGETTLHVFNVHLGTSFFERRRQGQMLVSREILQCYDLAGPRLILGDFNEWTRGLTSRLLAGHLESPDLRRHLTRSRTYPGVLPFLHLDQMYFDRSLKLEQLILHRSRTALVASDHLPLVADFRTSHSSTRA
jgi:endonuclease/exonuclease/phosphatase family metal-dependent hydrolase